MAKLHAIINVYNGAETILTTLESLLGKVDNVFVLDGRWIGVEGVYGNHLHSTDGTVRCVGKFAKKHMNEISIMIILADKSMHQVESRQFLLDIIPEGDWILVIDSDELMIWTDDFKKILETTKEKAFAIYGKNPRIKLGSLRFVKKTKNMRYGKNHRIIINDDDGEILLGDLKALPVQMVHHSKSNVKMMRKAMKDYESWLWDWENKE